MASPSTSTANNLGWRNPASVVSLLLTMGLVTVLFTSPAQKQRETSENIQSNTQNIQDTRIALTALEMRLAALEAKEVPRPQQREINRQIMDRMASIEASVREELGTIREDLVLVRTELHSAAQRLHQFLQRARLSGDHIHISEPRERPFEPHDSPHNPLRPAPDR